MNAKKWLLRLLTAVCVTAGVFSLSACDQLLGQASAPKVLYKISADGTYAEVTGSEGVLKEVVVQKEYEGLSVRVIQDNAFANCDTLTKVTLPSTIQAIGNKAFYDCDLLTKITLPEGVQHIGEDAFGDCASLAFKEYRNAKFLGTVANEYYALIEMTNKTQEGYKIDDGTKVIANGAFDDCIALTTLDFPKSVTSIGANAFADCHINAVYYHGTAAQWTALKTASASYTGLSSAKVYYYSVTQPTATGNYWHYEGDTPTPWSVTVSCVHNWQTVTTVAPTCIAPGQDKKSCTLCGKTEYIYKAIDSTAHSWGTVTTVAPTCTAQGYDKKTCTLCNTTHKSKYTAISNNAHSWGTVTTVAPTCTSQGYDTKTCWRCSTTQKSNYTAIDYDAHGTATNNVCSLCQHIVGTAGVVYTKYSTYATVTDYTGTATEVYIADTYKGVPVTSIGAWAFQSCYKLTRVVIPDGITSIGNYAFYYCSNLTSVVIPDGVTSIGAGAFDHCTSLTCITIPDGVTSIGARAFDHCTSLTCITIPKGVTTIDYAAFYNCSSLTEITIPYGVASVGDLAFYQCGQLKEVIIPDSVTHLGNQVFFDCTSLENVTLGSSIKKIGYQAFHQCSALTEIVIPDSVTSIDYNSFYKCDSLKNLTLGNGTTSIGEYAFYSCDSLTNLTFGNAITTIGAYAFFECTNLAELIIPNSVTTIGDYAFRFCSNATKLDLGDGVANLGKVVFANCSSLTEITLPEGMTSLPEGTFDKCENLTSVVIPASITNIGASAFSNCEKLSAIYYRGTESAWNEITIDESNIHFLTLVPYYYSESGPALNADETAYDGNYWHYGENGEIVVWEWTGTEGLAYQLSADGTYATVTDYTGTATEVVIAPTYKGVPVKIIDDYAFSDCLGLTNIIVSKNVISIREYAFFYCDDLTQIVIPRGVMFVAEFAFDSCSNLTIYCEAESQPSGWDSSWNTSNRPVYWYSESEPALNADGTAYDGNYWHYGENGEIVVWEWTGTAGLVYELSADGTYATVTNYMGTATEVVIPSTYQGVPVTTIGTSAFSGCDSLTEVVIPDSVTSIGVTAFGLCDSLTEIIIPDSVTYIGTFAFFDCGNLTIYCEATSRPSGWDICWTEGILAVYWYSESEPALNADETAYNGNYWHYGENGEIVVWEWTGTPGVLYDLYGDYAVVSGYNGTATEVVISPIYKGVPVTVIEGRAFYDKDTVESVFGESIMTIGPHAFYSCDNLQTAIFAKAVISLAEFEGAEDLAVDGTVGESAFEDCRNLTKLVLPDSVTSIGNNAFISCGKLTEVMIPESVKKVGNFAFAYCFSITEMVIPSGITDIGSSVFLYCTNLEKVVILDGLRRIGNEMFSYCTALKEVIIPDTVTWVDDYAFLECSSLTEIVISKNVIVIDYDAFSGCNSLTSVIFEDTSGWYRCTKNYVSTKTDISDPTVAATYLVRTYASCQWYKEN